MADDESSSALRSADPPRNFTLTVDERIRALTIGAPAYAVRKRKIEETGERWVRELCALHAALTAKGRAPVEIERALERKAQSYDYAKQNELVATHTRWYPVEANLPVDPRTGGYLVYGRPFCKEAEYTPARILRRTRERLAERADATSG